jgi:hypothetical protein
MLTNLDITRLSSPLCHIQVDKRHNQPNKEQPEPCDNQSILDHGQPSRSNLVWKQTVIVQLVYEIAKCPANAETVHL